MRAAATEFTVSSEDAAWERSEGSGIECIRVRPFAVNSFSNTNASNHLIYLSLLGIRRWKGSRGNVSLCANSKQWAVKCSQRRYRLHFTRHYIMCVTSGNKCRGKRKKKHMPSTRQRTQWLQTILDGINNCGELFMDSWPMFLRITRLNYRFVL